MVLPITNEIMYVCLFVALCERYDEVFEFGGMTKQRQFVTESSHSLGSDFGKTGKLLVS